MSLSRTYLKHCLKNGLCARWPNNAMPIGVYIAPFTWYEKSKQAQADFYRTMVIEALQTWSQATQGKIQFKLLPRLDGSQIDIKWRRVNRTSLGLCTYLVNDQSMMYSAEIEIGISDGLVHARYNDAGEVRHTILHEIAHALGVVGHSDHPDDIMYVPHQFGTLQPSPRDIDTMSTLYQLPVGFDYRHAAQELGMLKTGQPKPGFDDVLDAFLGLTPPVGGFPGQLQQVVQNVKASATPDNPQALLHEQDILSTMGQFYLATQNIQVTEDLRKRLIMPD